MPKGTVTPNQIIQRIHEEAKRMEVHATVSLYRHAVAREKTWKKLSPDAQRRVLALAECDFNFIDMAIEDVVEGAAV